MVSTGGEDQDVIGLARSGDMGCVQVFFIRDGKLTGRDHFFLTSLDDTGDDEALAAFIKQYYSNADLCAQGDLALPRPEEAEVLTEWLSGRRGSKVTLRVPQRGEKRRLVEMVTENAALVLAERESEQSRRLARVEQGLTELKELWGCPRFPGGSKRLTSPTPKGRKPWPRWWSSSTASRRRRSTAASGSATSKGPTTLR